jgi:oligopeptide/dipeptide ABC transporter ATP-binding protein
MLPPALPIGAQPALPVGAQPALIVENLSLAIGPAQVVDRIGFAVAPGEVLSLVGESGCGKSLTAAAIMRLLPDAVRQTGGSIRLGAEDICAYPERRMQQLRGRRLSMIFQEPQAALDPLSPIGAQIAEALRQPASQARPAVLRMLRDVGISDPERRIDQYPFELSGGMCQRVMIASALIAHPAVLLADEPTTALDVTIQAQILDLLRRLATERQTAVVLITHDMGVVADIADRVAVMYAGRIAETGPTEALFAAPRHPYTALLLASIPRLTDEPKSKLAVIEGRVPTPAEFGPGCRFASRCPLADQRCTQETPPLRPIGENRLTACFHAERVA